jgi:hypothetical protein
MPLIFVAFIAAVIITLVHKKVKQSMVFSNYKVLNGISVLIFPIAFLLLFCVQLSGIDFYNRWLPDFYSGHLFEGEDTYIITLNIASDYLGKLGIILSFGLIGFISLSRTAFNGFGRLFVVLSVLTLTPFLVIEDYTPEFILPFFSILVGFGLINTYDILKQRKRIVFSILAICIVASTGFSWFMLDHWYVHTHSMSDKTYATASFLEDKANGTSVANHGLLSCQISAFSGKACLPYGGAYAQPISPEQLIYGSVKADEVVTRPLPLSKIISDRMLYVPINALPSAKNDWAHLMGYHYWANKTKILCSKYDMQYAVEAVRYSGEYWHWRGYYSRLLMSLQDSGDKIYANGRENIWYLS